MHRQRGEDQDPDMDSDGIPESEMEDFDGFGDPLLNRLMTGDWSAVDEMSDDINKDMDIVQEIKVKTLAMEEKIPLE